jgi:hypothetical protein
MNEHVLRDFYNDLIAGEFNDGMSHQLYLDKADGNKVIVKTEAGPNTWHQRNDGSLVKLFATSGMYCNYSGMSFSEFLQELQY